MKATIYIPKDKYEIYQKAKLKGSISSMFIDFLEKKVNNYEDRTYKVFRGID